MQKVVITGIGVMSALGNCRECFWNSLLNGPAPFRKVTRFETAPLSELYAAEVMDFEPAVPVNPKHVWTGARSIQFAIATARQALADAGIVVDDANRSDIGVVFGSTQSCLDLAVKLDVDGILRGPRTVSPLLFPHVNPSAPSCRVSLQLGLQAFNTILSNGPTSGLDAIHYAANAIREGHASVVLAGGLEELTRMTFLYHQSMERLASHPFGAEGIILGEGCAVLVLEEECHARSRGANILAEVSGYGSYSDAPEFAMLTALDAAGLRPEEVDVVFASANGDARGDRVEADALQRTIPGAPVATPKSRLGETHSAAGALHAAACVLAMNRGVPGAIRAALINCFSTSRSTQIGSSLVLKAC